MKPPALGTATSSEFEMEPVQGRKVSKVVKTTVVKGKRMEKQTGDPSLAADLPSAREDFEKVNVQIMKKKSFKDLEIYISKVTAVEQILVGFPVFVFAISTRL